MTRTEKGTSPLLTSAYCPNCGKSVYAEQGSDGKMLIRCPFCKMEFQTVIRRMD